MVLMSWVKLANWQLLGNSPISALVTSDRFAQSGGVAGTQLVFCPASQGGFFVALVSTKGVVTKSGLATERGGSCGGSGEVGGSEIVLGTPSPLVVKTVKIRLVPLFAQTWPTTV